MPVTAPTLASVSCVSRPVRERYRIRQHELCPASSCFRGTPVHKLPSVVRVSPPVLLSETSRAKKGKVHPRISMAALADSAVSSKAADTRLDPSKQDVKEALAVLSSKKREWASLPIPAKLQILKELGDGLAQMPKEEWARQTVHGCRVDSTDTDVALQMVVNTSFIAGEIKRFTETLEALQRTGKGVPLPITERPDGQKVVHVYPASLADKWGQGSFLGAKVEVWIEPGQPASQGAFYVPGSSKAHDGRVCVVLGAGNLAALSMVDVFTRLFIDGDVCLLKHHPLQAAYAPYMERLMEPLIRRGYLRSLVGGADVAQAALYDPATDAVHMTGGLATYEAILWGSSPEERERRKVANDPLLKVPITSELGGVTPWVVVPGQWTPGEMEFAASQLALAIHDNQSCNCLAAKIVLVSADWPQRVEFMEALKRTLGSVPLRYPWYPGLVDRYNKFKAAYPKAQQIATTPRPEAVNGPGRDLAPVPWLVADVHLSETSAEEYAFLNEPFAPVVTFLTLPSNTAASTRAGGGANAGSGATAAQDATVPAFLQQATDICNQRLLGDLTCTLLVDPRAEAAHRDAVEAAIAHLAYGTVMVNGIGFQGYYFTEGAWGGFQSRDKSQLNVGSGLGMVRNGYMFDYPEKTVVRLPFRGSPTPPSPEIPMVVARLMVGAQAGGFTGAMRGLMGSV